MTCDAKLRLFWPINDTEIQCHLHGDHAQHESVLRDYAYAGSRTEISWAEDDRRTFRGDWVPCLTSSVKCMLPAGHRGNHAS